MITHEQIQELRNEGYSDEQIKRVMAESQFMTPDVQQYQMPTNAQPSYFSNSLYNTNLIQYQLDPSDVKEEIEHFLRGDKLIFDGKNKYWKSPDSIFDMNFSEKGVEEVMKIVSGYVNRTFILSDFDEQTILWKTKDFGDTINSLFKLKWFEIFAIPTMEQCFQRVYEVDDSLKEIDYDKFFSLLSNKSDINNYVNCWEFYMVVDKNNIEYPLSLGMYDRINAELENWTSNKVKLYRATLVWLTDIIHATYRRALFGGERQSLREVRSVSETINPQSYQPIIQQPMMREPRSIFNPMRWIKGKY